MGSCELEEYLARAWALHINETDGSLTLEARMGCLNSSEVVDTFVGFLTDYLKHIPAEEIYERTIQEFVYSLEPPRYLRTLLLQSYAECIMLILKRVQHDDCVGCNYGIMGHPSQRYHSCLGTVNELLDRHFDTCLEILDGITLLTRYTEKLYGFECAIRPDADLRLLILRELDSLPVTCAAQAI